jgi:hypothetical protein
MIGKLILGSDIPLPVGTVVNLPSLDVHGNLLPAQPTFVIREATVEEWLECVRAQGVEPPVAFHARRQGVDMWLYEVSTD